jgi:LPS export ABC transporter protein LptC/lipopolysaccharide transport protein LptA
MNNKINISVAVLLLITVLSSITVFKVVKESKASRINNPDMPDFFIKSVGYTKMDDTGVVQQSIYVPELTHYKAGDSTVFQKPTVIFRVNQQAEPWEINADSGTSKFGLDTINLTGNVVISQAGNANNKATIITTNSATIFFDKKYAKTDQLVTIQHEGLLAKAIGANADFNANILNLSSNVEEVYNSDEAGKAGEIIFLKSNRATYDRKKHISSYFGKVVYTQGESFLQADKLIIYDNPVDNRVQKIVAFGNPAYYSTIPDANPNAKSNRINAKALRIEYYPLKKIALLIGDGELTQKGNKFSGPHIVYNLEQKTILSTPISTSCRKNCKRQSTTILIKP